MLSPPLAPINSFLFYESFAKRVYMNCFRCQKPSFFPRRTFWRTEQTQIAFVEFEERLIGEKMAFVGSGMNSHTPSKERL